MVNGYPFFSRRSSRRILKHPRTHKSSTMMPSGLPRPGNRKDSAIRTLVAETLVLAKTHGYVEKIESELEEELRRDLWEPPEQTVARWRRDGEKILKSKYMLLTVVLFCVTDCALVLGELILDLHKVRDTLENSEQMVETFILRLRTRYPVNINETDSTEIEQVFQKILEANISWKQDILHQSDSHSHWHKDTMLPHHSDLRFRRNVVSDSSSVGNYTDENRTAMVDLLYHKNFHSVENDIAHAFHYASISILAILVIETILKAVCAGKSFCHRKLEVFDAIIVIVSFLVDLVFLNLSRFKIQDFVFILAFLLPWRVIRVVNSLVVSVKDHEHFRLKLVYSRKKKIQHSLRETEVKLQIYRCQCNALRKLCITEGVDEWRVDQLLRIDEYIVNKAGKSKCKIRIDDSSVIIFNDKNDIPKLSPRPSISNLCDLRGRGGVTAIIEEEEPLTPEITELHDDHPKDPGKQNGVIDVHC
ncbi:uncharacterized protein LOC121382048 [Gigantopelta aegis]|uniref:uncharacterized protein LOC121382048 n=1 Tax=Gigantopelta aegis TaxID=1735272 RepID=UPI001B88BE60|nr:uncharacterized protein LOC121382048 [Gigantopelta aegis]